MSRLNIKITYAGFSLYAKIVFGLIAGVGALIEQFFGESIKFDATPVIAITSVGIALLVASDNLFKELNKNNSDTNKKHDEVIKEQLILHKSLQQVSNEISKKIDEHNANVVSTVINLENCMRSTVKNTELFSATKTRLRTHDLKRTWTSMMRYTSTEFVAINYLSHKCWETYGGDKLVKLLGSIVENFTINQPRRVLIVDSIEETFLWERVIALHKECEIQIKVMLREDYLRIRAQFCEMDDSYSISTVDGFNIIDPENPGWVLNWNYTEDRDVNFADLLRGREISLRYYDFFNTVWKGGTNILKSPEYLRYSGNVVPIHKV